MYRIPETFCEKRDVKHVFSILGFLCRQKVKKKSRLMSLVQCFCDLYVPRTESAAAATMSKDDPPEWRRRDPEESG
jgi:hypothetical protein